MEDIISKSLKQAQDVLQAFVSNPDTVSRMRQAVDMLAAALENGNMMPADIKAQTKQSLENIKAILESEGLSMKNVVKTTVLMQNMGDFNDMNAVYSEFFTEECPARAAFEVAKLPKNALVEIEAIAYIK